MMKKVVWTKSIESERLKDILRSFPDCEISDSDNYEKGADLDIIFGSWKERNVPHHNLKRNIVKNSKNVLVLETPLLDRGPQEEVMSDNWFRIGLNGFMRNAQYLPVSEDRLSYKLADKFISSTGMLGTDYILVVLQLPGDASLDFIDINDWCIDKVNEIRSITNRDIVIRFPQLDREFNVFDRLSKVTNIFFQKGTYNDRKVTLDSAYAVVTYSSGFGVEAILNGNRTFIESENGFWSTKTSLENVLKKDYYNFSDSNSAVKWKKFIESTQWHIDEIKSGKCLKMIEELIK